MTEVKSVTDMIEEVKEQMCNDYCRYTHQSWEALEEDRILEICENCPLNRL